MNNFRNYTNVQTGGYLSEDHKRKFTITAGILAAVFFIAQFILPYIIMIFFTSFTYTLRDNFLDELNINDAVYWNGSIWLTAVDNYSILPDLRKINLEKPDEIEFAGLAYDADININSETGNELIFRNPKLLPDDDKLWIISYSTVGLYSEGQTVKVIDTKNLGDFCRPFLYEGKPAVVEQRPDGFFLLTLENDQWQETDTIENLKPDSFMGIQNNLQVLAENSILHIFVRRGNTIFYKKKTANKQEENSKDWQIICKSKRNYCAFLDNNGKPVIFASGAIEPGEQITGFEYTGEKWEPFFSHKARYVRDIAAIPLPGTNKKGIIYSSVAGYKLMEIEDGEIVNEVKYGSDDYYPTNYLLIAYLPYVFSIILSFILAIILTRLMRKHKVCVHKSYHSTMAYASLIKRALAQIIDIIVIGWPYITGIIIIVLQIFDIDYLTRPTVFSYLGFMIFGLFWVILLLLIYSATEGKYGITIGKWIMRIRVLGTDLRPCGFGRAFLRNILKFVDGFFNFIVGIMIAALTDNWQRVGDLAARTVVVEAGTKNIIEKQEYNNPWDKLIQKKSSEQKDEQKRCD